jgi:hypothetical protein
MKHTERVAQDGDLRSHFERSKMVRQPIISRNRETCFSTAPSSRFPFGGLRATSTQALDYVRCDRLCWE